MFDGATSVSDPDLYRERFDSHYAGVAEWFADRPDALLTMTFDGSASWVELCEHLGHPTPTYPFPRSNPLSERSASFLRRVRRRLMRMWQERFGSGGPETRCGQLYDRCHAVTGAIDAALPADATAFSAFLDAATGRVVSLKAALGIPYEPAGSGIDGDTPSARWARFRFELRHTIGQVSYSTIDVGFDGGTIGDSCSRLLDDVSAWAITPPTAD